mmetsp:Transcript_132339/g.197195  ORF Transcript_132339/g.197195 Transcript_132339/m.197195 type:complete len:224 (-) Transcript_132339:265-936(-)
MLVVYKIAVVHRREFATLDDLMNSVDSQMVFAYSHCARTQLIVLFCVVYLLLSLVWSCLLHIRHYPLGILSNLVEISTSNCFWVKQRRYQTNRCRSHFQVIPSIIQVNSRSRVDAQKRKCRTNGLYPHRAASDTREELLEGCSVPVGIDHFSRSLAPWNAHNIAFFAPFDHVWKHHGCNDEFTSGIHSSCSIVRIQNGTATNHHISVVFRTEISKMLKTVRSG